jgi:hypothetical protein
LLDDIMSMEGKKGKQGFKNILQKRRNAPARQRRDFRGETDQTNPAPEDAGRAAHEKTDVKTKLQKISREC